MCGCNQNLLKYGFTGNDLFQDSSLRESLVKFKMINAKDFKEGNPLQIMQYASCIDSVQFYNMFKNLGLDFEPKDLPQLAELINQGADKKGLMKNANGQPVYFDAMKMIREMEITPEQFHKAQCSIYFVQ